MADQCLVGTMTFSKDHNPADIYGAMQSINSMLAENGIEGFMGCRVLMQTDMGWDEWKPTTN